MYRNEIDFMLIFYFADIVNLLIKFTSFFFLDFLKFYYEIMLPMSRDSFISPTLAFKAFLLVLLICAGKYFFGNDCLYKGITILQR